MSQLLLLLSSAFAAALELHSLVETNSSVYNFTLPWQGATSGVSSIVLFRPTGSYILVDFEVLDAAGAVAIERSHFLLCSDNAMVQTPTPLSTVASPSRRRRLKGGGGRSGGGRSSGGSRGTSGTSTRSFSSSGVSRTSGFSAGSGRGFRSASRSRYGSFGGSGYKTPGATAGARTLRAHPGGSTRSFTSSKAGATSSTQSSSFAATRPGVGAGSGASVRSSATSYGYSKARLGASGRFPSGYRATAYGVSGRNALRPGGTVRRYRPQYYPMYYPYYIGGYGYGMGYGRRGSRRYYDDRSGEEACASSACSAAYPGLPPNATTTANCSAAAGGCTFNVQHNMTRDDLLGAGAFDASAAQYPLTVIVHLLQSFANGTEAYSAARALNLSAAARCGGAAPRGASAGADAEAEGAVEGAIDLGLAAANALASGVEAWDSSIFLAVTEVDDLEITAFAYDASLAVYGVIMACVLPLGALLLLALLAGGAAGRKARLIVAIARHVKRNARAVSPGADADATLELVQARPLAAAPQCARGADLAAEPRARAPSHSKEAIALCEALGCAPRTAMFYLEQGGGVSERAAERYFESGGLPPPADWSAARGIAEGGAARGPRTVGEFDFPEAVAAAAPAAAVASAVVVPVENPASDALGPREAEAEDGGSCVPPQRPPSLATATVVALPETPVRAPLPRRLFEAKLRWSNALPTPWIDFRRLLATSALAPGEQPPEPPERGGAVPGRATSERSDVERSARVMDLENKYPDATKSRVLCCGGGLCLFVGALGVAALLVASLSQQRWSSLKLEFAHENRTECRALAVDFFGIDELCRGDWSGCAGDSATLYLGLREICATPAGGAALECVAYHAGDDARAVSDDASAHFFGILEGRSWCTFATTCALLCAAGSLVAQALNWLFKAYDVREADSSVMAGTSMRGDVNGFGALCCADNDVRGGSCLMRIALPCVLRAPQRSCARRSARHRVQLAAQRGSSAALLLFLRSAPLAHPGSAPGRTHRYGLLGLAAWFSFVTATLWFFFVDPQLQDRVSTFCFDLSSTACCSSGDR